VTGHIPRANAYHRKSSIRSSVAPAPVFSLFPFIGGVLIDLLRSPALSRHSALSVAWSCGSFYALQLILCLAVIVNFLLLYYSLTFITVSLSPHVLANVNALVQSIMPRRAISLYLIPTVIIFVAYLHSLPRPYLSSSVFTLLLTYFLSYEDSVP